MSLGIRVRSILMALVFVPVLLTACSDAVTDPATVTVSVSPPNVSLVAGESRQFTATVTGAAETGVTWSASAGQVSGSGNTVTFTAPATEGTHTLRATSVADPTRSASASITVSAADVLLNRAPVPASGGSVVVDRPNSPLHGMRVELDPMTYPTTSYWTIIEEPDVQLTLPGGITQATTSFRIRNEQGFADEPFGIRIPVQLQEGEVPTAFIQDPVTGALELVPSLGLDEDGLWVVTHHVSRDQMWESAGNPGSGAIAAFDSSPSANVALSTEFGTEIRFILVKTAELSGPFGVVHTTFQPGVDDWEFPNYGSALTPRGFCGGSTITAMYYHYFHKSAEGPLFGRYKVIDYPDFWISNGRGIRLASVVQDTLNWHKYSWNLFVNRFMPSFDEYSLPFLQIVNLATAMRVTGLPQLVAIYGENWSNGHALTAYGMRDGTVLVADPNAPGQAREIHWGGSHWAYGEDWVPFSFSEIVGGPEEIYTKVWPVGISTMIDVEQLHAHWAQFEEGTIGDAEFPAKEFEYQDPQLDEVWRIAGDTIRTANDSLVFRWRCDCTWVWETPSGQSRQLTALYGPGPQYVPLGVDWADESLEGVPVLPEMGKQGMWIGHSQRMDWDDLAYLFANFSWTMVHRFSLSLTADNETPAPDEVVTFTVDQEGLDGVVPRFRWDFGDGTVTETLGAYDAEHAYLEPGSYEAAVAVLDENDVIVARTSIRIGIGGVPYWRITAFSDHDNLLSDEEITGSSPTAELLQRLVSNPRSGLFAVDATDDGGTELRLRVRRSGVWDEDDCCPILPPSNDELVQALGTDPPVPHGVGPFFADWDSDFWAQSTPDLDGGTMTGQQALGHATYQIRNGGSQRGPAGGLRLQATRDGTAMTGVLTVTIWWWNEVTGEVEHPGEIFRFPFQAVRFAGAPEQPPD